MTGRTHDLAAFTLLNTVFIFSTLPPMRVSTVVGALGACFIGGLFPDLDQSTADLYNRLPAGSIIGKIIAPLLGSHRLLSHSILGITIIGYLMKLLLARLGLIVLIDMNIAWWAFMIGVVSHIIMDSLTRDGVPLLFPFRWKFGFPPLKALRMKTGGLIEKLIVFPALLIVNGYLVYKFYFIYLTFFKQYIH